MLMAVLIVFVALESIWVADYYIIDTSLTIDIAIGNLPLATDFAASTTFNSKCMPCAIGTYPSEDLSTCLPCSDQNYMRLSTNITAAVLNNTRTVYDYQCICRDGFNFATQPVIRYTVVIINNTF